MCTSGTTVRARLLAAGLCNALQGSVVSLSLVCGCAGVGAGPGPEQTGQATTELELQLELEVELEVEVEVEIDHPGVQWTTTSTIVTYSCSHLKRCQS